MDIPLATVKQGQLRGCVRTNLDGEKFLSFLGIPYAKPPVGKLRFKAPLPAEPWDGIRDATEEGSPCCCPDDIEGGSEDCLFINVFTKELPRSNNKLKPVMVWIHGGGFVSGSSSTSIYGPEFLMLEDIVLVTFNYRLGILGFLTLDDPSLGIPGSAGLKDQLLALRWVQENIRNFNGDPDNVTLFGESAGSASVHYHVLSQNKGLFHKAILQSGCAINFAFSLGFNVAVEFARFLGSNANSEKEALEVFNNTPLEVLMKSQSKFMELKEIKKRGIPFAPVVERPNDTAILSRDAIDVILSGEYNKVPMIIGYNTREGMLFDAIKVLLEMRGGKSVPEGDSRPPDSEEAVLSHFQLQKDSDVGRRIYNKIMNIYFKGDDKDDNARLLTSDVMFTAGIITILMNHLKTNTEPIYVYRMSLVAGLNFLKNLTQLHHLPGTSHADDIGYLFNTMVSPEITPGSLEDASLRKFVKLWTNFAKYGNPTPNQDEFGISWPACRTSPIGYVDIGRDLTLGTDPEAERWNFWKEMFKLDPLTVKFSDTINAPSRNKL